MLIHCYSQARGYAESPEHVGVDQPAGKRSVVPEVPMVMECNPLAGLRNALSDDGSSPLAVYGTASVGTTQDDSWR